MSVARAHEASFDDLGVELDTAPRLAVQPPAPTERTSAVPLHAWLFLGFVVTNVFSGQVGRIGIPVPLDRLLLALAVLVMVLDYRTGRLRPRYHHVVMLALVLWVLWSWMSTGSVNDSYNAFALADRICVPFVMFLIGPLMFPDTRSRLLLLKTLALVGLYLGFTGIFEVAHLDRLVFPSFIADNSIGLQQGRARGPFLASEPMGMATAIIMISCGVLVWASRSVVWRITGVVSGAACATTVLLCLTRSAWIGGATSVVLCFACVPALRRRIPVALAGGALLVAAVIGLVPSVTGLVSARADNARTAYDRILTDHAAVRIIEAKPIFGVGWQRFIDVVDVWVRQADTYPLTNTAIAVHNVFLSLAAETGILGAVLWALAMLGGPIAVVIARRHRSPEMQAWRLLAACAVLVWIGPTLLSPNPYPFPNNLIWLIGGIAGGAMLARPAPGRTTRAEAMTEH